MTEQGLKRVLPVEASSVFIHGIGADGIGADRFDRGDADVLAIEEDIARAVATASTTRRSASETARRMTSYAARPAEADRTPGSKRSGPGGT